MSTNLAQTVDVFGGQLVKLAIRLREAGRDRGLWGDREEDGRMERIAN